MIMNRTYQISMRIKNTCFLFLLITGLTVSSTAQNTKEREVISSGGIESNTSTLRVSSTIGETVVSTEQSGTSPLTITQGFHQPGDPDSITIDSLVVTPAACIGRNNGRAFIDPDSIKGCEGPYTFNWSTGSTSNQVFGLAPGNYSVQISSTDNCQKTFFFTIGYESNAPCFINFFTGITPNGDGNNDAWIIENVEAFANNKVTIYNRLGNIVFEEKNYDNVNVVWKGNTGNNLNGKELPSDTYFYVFESNGEFEKGWIELTRF